MASWLAWRTKLILFEGPVSVMCDISSGTTGITSMYKLLLLHLVKWKLKYFLSFLSINSPSYILKEFVQICQTWFTFHKTMLTWFNYIQACCMHSSSTERGPRECMLFFAASETRNKATRTRAITSASRLYSLLWPDVKKNIHNNSAKPKRTCNWKVV